MPLLSQFLVFSLNTCGTDFNTVDTSRDNQIHPDSGPDPYAPPSAASAVGSGDVAIRIRAIPALGCRLFDRHPYRSARRAR